MVHWNELYSYLHVNLWLLNNNSHDNCINQILGKKEMLSVNPSVENIKKPTENDGKFNISNPFAELWPWRRGAGDISR